MYFFNTIIGLHIESIVRPSFVTLYSMSLLVLSAVVMAEDQDMATSIATGMAEAHIIQVRPRLIAATNESIIL